jgi:diguanylate cyclase (GGDEF)-like protein
MTRQKQDLELIHIFANQAAVAIQNTQLYEMATLDPLTGSYIRRFFEKCLLRELRTAFRSKQSLCLLMLDIDDMKNINDSAGHPTGDRALAAIGSVLREVTRTTDIVGRYGGDEFIIVLPQTTLEGMEIFVKRIYEGLQRHVIAAPAGDFQLKCSIGGSEIKASAVAENMPIPVPQQYFQSAAQALIRAADNSLYEAKRGGGNRLVRGSILNWSEISAEMEAKSESENHLDETNEHNPE